ncbi:MAG: hypothetical protein JRN35_04785 [Nitrososphaerota archaeon]|jgi:hypothetical protein|nr:hypothetical protein [Nitrososphaerota archaeon]
MGSKRCARCGQPFKDRASRYHDVFTGKDYHVYHAPNVRVRPEALEFRPASELVTAGAAHPTERNRSTSTRPKRPRRRIGLDY